MPVKTYYVLGTPYLGSRLRGRDIRAVQTGEKRCPKKGEWFLSGAIPEAYLASNDLTTPYHILKLVQVKIKEVVEVLGPA